MKTYIADIIPKIKRFSQKLDDLTKLTNQHWVSIGDIGQTKRVYIFRANDQLLISENGIVEKGRWEYLENQSLLVETSEGSYLLKQSFFDQNIIALKLDSTNNYVFFVNESRYDKELNTIDDCLNFLRTNYLNTKSIKSGSSKSPFNSEKQKEWIEDQDRCPGCGFVGVRNKGICPDCGLNLT